MGLFAAPLCSRGCGAVRGSAVPEVGAASGKQREIKARRARRQLETGACVRGCACVWAWMCSHSTHTCGPDAFEPLGLSPPPLQSRQSISLPAGLERRGTPKRLRVPPARQAPGVMGKTEGAQLVWERVDTQGTGCSLLYLLLNETRDNVRLKSRNVRVIAGSLLLSCCVQHNYQC